MKITQTNANYRNQRFHKTPNCLYILLVLYTNDIKYHNIKLLRAWR